MLKTIDKNKNIDTYQQFYQPIKMSKFDERILKSTSDVFYFQIIPKQLLNLSPSITSLPQSITQQTQSISFKLYKGSLILYLGQQLSDESKSITPMIGWNNNIQIKKAFINFNVTKYNHETNVEFIMKLYANFDKQKNYKKYHQTIQEHYQYANKYKLKKNQIGSFSILANYYVDQFLNSGTKEFNQNVKINEEFCFQFDIFVEKSRFGLEKFIRESRQTKKSGTDRKSMRDNLKRSDTRFQLKLRGPMIDSPKSQVIEQVLQNQALSLSENKFISPSRKIIKEKKLLVRNQSAKKSNTKIPQSAKFIRNPSSFQNSQLPCERDSSSKGEKRENLDHQQQSLNKLSKNSTLQIDKNKQEQFSQKGDQDKINNSLKHHEEISDDFFEFPEKSLSSRQIITTVNSNNCFINKTESQKQRNHSKIHSQISSNFSSQSQNSSITKPQTETKQPQEQSSQEITIDEETSTLSQSKISRFLEFGNNRFLVIFLCLVSVIILVHAITPDEIL